MSFPRNRRGEAVSRLYDWLLSADHKTIGVQYTVTSLCVLLVGFLMILLMRWQLAYPGQPLPIIGRFFGPNHPGLPNGAMEPNFYNQLGAIHGTVMIFLAVVPLTVGGFGSYLVPLMIGAANVAFPRIYRAGFWLYLLGGLIIFGSFFSEGGAANSGWTAYPPLSVIERAGQSYWLIGICCVYASSLIMSITLIVTIVQLRTRGMHFMRLPFFVWTQLVTALLLVLAFPPLAAAGVLQLMDRVHGTSFFLPSGLIVSGKAIQATGGGSALLWQHLFWFLAHPEVYVLILPAFGIVAEIIANNTRRPLWGYRGMVGAALFMGVMSLLVWAHHMYLTGMGSVMNVFFQATTLIISIPSFIMATSLLMSLWGGSIRFTVPMLFALAFLPMFAIGGLTGIPLALSSTNIVLHDTYYVVGHFHYVVAPGTLFALFGGIYYWFPRVTGRRMNERLGKLHFWSTLFFMNMTFLPMMIQGLAGVPRRLYDGGTVYAHAQEVFFLNKAVSHSAFALAIVQLPFLINFFYSLFRGEKMSRNPWDATTLEWLATSPPRSDGNFDTPPTAYRGPNEYSVPGHSTDFTPQWQKDNA